ncbi:MAG TPA: Ppx/GppA phosphatase family protein [Egibacteraceae bacterium]|nr:Ppx/GppA family phosphatase [Actinomycetota bacterium]HWB72556.1 Ppx/GppA phosphatase family protein [Egibacteraceae bacterium]
MTRVAAVDVGTNSVRLLVADPPDGGRQSGPPLVTVERRMTVTRLGSGVDAAGHLDDAALSRTLDCIGAYADRWRDLGARRVRVAATSAIRDAADRDRFLRAVRERVGEDAEVLSGEDEGRLTFLGATASVDGVAPYLVLDIGGGSTEFIVGSGHPEAMTSLQLGCVRMTERCLASDPPTAEELAAAVEVADEQLEAVAEEFDPAGVATLIGVAGTVTTLGALHLGLEEYQAEEVHGTRLPAAAVAELTGLLAAMTAQERADLGPMAPGREDVIVAGALILERVVQRWGFGEVLVSEADILDGLALSLLGSQKAAG